MNQMSDNNTQYRLEISNVSKAFPGVQALNDVSLKIKPGEVHALVGENGAGKSTLIKILSGVYQGDTGQIGLDGVDCTIDSPAHALRLGIVTIYQELSLSLELNVAENIYMGRLPSWSLWVNRRQLHQQTQELLNRLGVAFSSHTKVKDLSPAQRQMVEIAKALSMSARIIVLDEPTASLTDHEVSVLLNVMRQLKESGVSIIFVTHRLGEVFAVADMVTVLRDGQWILSAPIADIKNEDALVYSMVGRQVDNIYDDRSVEVGHIALSIQKLSGKGFTDISFAVRFGEIVGMFGLVGSGRTEVVRAVFGAQPVSAGSIEMESRLLTPKHPKDSIRAGIALIPEERKAQGLVLDLSVQDNIALPNLSVLSRAGFMNRRAEKRLASAYKQSLDIRCPDVNVVSKSLSGGNQQKVVIAKWLSRHPKVLILDEPTRGIDVGGKAEVHKLMNRLADEGAGVLMVSSDLPEILGMSDRILVMHEGRLAADISRDEATEELIMSFAAGQAVQQQSAEGL